MSSLFHYLLGPLIPGLAIILTGYVTGTEVRNYGGPIISSFVGPSRTNVTRNSGLVGPTFLVL